LGDAPLWLSLMFLMHEIAIYVVPYLFALSIGTLIMGVLRPTLSSLGNLLHSAYGSWGMTPIRVLLRIATNVVVIATYLSYHLLVNTFVSESSVWPPAAPACICRPRDLGSTTRSPLLSPQCALSCAPPAWTYGVGGG
jgi:hypothetical protein